MFPFSPGIVRAALLGAALLSTSPSHALTIVLNGSNGADYDAVGDGWFFAGGMGIPPDGVGDAGGNALGIAYQSGVVEQRAMAEFPLALLASYEDEDVVSATLTFTIDDVLSTFGPGTSFDGTAANPIAVYSYPADGTVTTADFSPSGLVQEEIVVTGVITDASLGTTGSLSFTVDVTQTVKDFLSGSQSHFGALFGTADTPTGTSLDDLAPPGVPGGQLPFLTIEVESPAPPTYTNDQLKCQAAVDKAAAKFASTKQKAIAKCLNAILKTVSKGLPATDAEEKCRKDIDEANPESKLAKAKAKTQASIASACGALTPADIGSPCDPGATTIAQLATCVVDETEADVERMIATRFATACLLLDAIDLDEAFPTMCP